MDKIESKEIHFQQMRYGNTQANVGNHYKSDKIKFFISQITRIAELLY